MIFVAGFIFRFLACLKQCLELVYIEVVYHCKINALNFNILTNFKQRNDKKEHNNSNNNKNNNNDNNNNSHNNNNNNNNNDNKVPKAVGTRVSKEDERPYLLKYPNMVWVIYSL